MGLRKSKTIVFLVIFTACLYIRNVSGCTVVFDPGVPAGPIQHSWIKDTFRGNFWQNQTTGIAGIHTLATGSRAYYSIDIVNSLYVLSTTALFDLYEEYEVDGSMTISSTFRCTDGSTSSSFPVWVHVIDTNNNPPRFFEPPDGFIFTIAAPVPPGFEITGCLHDMIVRDIDLTTDKIIFDIEENPYFEIEKEIFKSDATPKNFSAIIRTKTFIRSFPETITLTVSATDHDQTNDPPRTTKTTITIIGNPDFELPEEPVFSQTFYLANYTTDNRVVLTEPITLQNGFDELVKFDIIGEFSHHFELESIPDHANQRSIRVVNQLEGDILRQTNIHLIVTAERELTSGASATVVLWLPEVVPLEFQTAHYEGTIENNNLRVPQLILSQGYEGATVTASVRNEHSSFFTTAVQGNTVTLSMKPLDESIINENSFLNLEVLATNGLSTATTVVTLEIIKDDNVTPVFNKAIYTGSYDPAGLTLEPIVLVQGYNGIDDVDLYGDYKDFFKAELTGTTVNVSVPAPIPPEIYSRERIVLSLEVRKPRTVGASAAIIINLPAIVPLEFQTAHYEGTIENNNLRVPQLILSQGYEGATVTASVRNEHSSFFTTAVQGNTVTLSMKPLDESIINENSFLNLEILATNGLSTATTVVTLEIIKDDNVTPVFNKAIYTGSYDPAGLTLEPIVLVQGYNGIDDVDLFGDYKDFFKAELTGTTVNVSVPEPIPPEIYSRERIVLSLEVRKPRTVGASAAIIINLPEVVPLEFQTAHYEGSIENNNLRVPQLILSQGYEGATVNASVRNEHSSFFTTAVQGNTVTLSMKPLDESIINENSFLILEVLATNGLSTATTVVTLEIIKDDNVTPVFNKAIYTGSYDPAGLTLEPIVLLQGYDGIDDVDLFGDYKNFFKAELTGTTVNVSVPEPIPPEIYSRERIVLSLEVRKPWTVGASAAIIINLPEAREMKFGASTYRGRLQDKVLTLDPIPLTVGFDSSVVFSLTGDYKDYFQVSSGQNPVIITLKPDIPGSVLLENNIIILTLVASGPNAVTTTTSVLLDIIKDDTTTPVFSRNIYYGTYLGPSQVNIDDIKLSQGFDSSVTFRLDGGHADYFEIKEGTENNVVVVPRASIPEEVIFKEKVLVFNVLAEKSLTVGANAAISIEFPSDLTERAIMRFSQNTYNGTIENTNLTVESISLSSGYVAGTQFILTGDLSEHFALRPNDSDGSVLSLSLVKPLPVASTENTFIVLEIEARRERAISGWTSVVLEIIRKGIIAPVFAQAYYRGAYKTESGLKFDQVISLSHGYDDTVVFSLDGEFGSLFILDEIGTNSLSIKPLEPISNDLLQANSQFLFTVVATKPETLSARSAISIDIERDLTDDQMIIMRFSQNTYTGTIENTNLTVESISLSSGYEAGTQFILTGDLQEHFALRPNDSDGSILSLSLVKPLPVASAENTFIVLEIEARRERAISGWTSVVVEIIRRGIVAPVFTQAFYRGAYNTESGLKFDQVISLSHGYDDTVVFSLDGEFGSLFILDEIGTNSLSIKPLEPISNDLLQTNSQFLFTVVATKPETLATRSAISIDIERDLSDDQMIIMRFSQNTYTGTIENTNLTVESISLSSGYVAGTQFILTGDLSEHFALRPNDSDGSVLSLSLVKPLPVASTENTFIVLEIEARRQRAISGWTSVVIEIIRQGIVAPVFTQAYYRGVYNTESGLKFDQVISLSHGYDDTVVFSLDGEFGSLFVLDEIGTNSLSIKPLEPISNDLLQANSQFLFTVVATKPETLSARSAISIDIERDLTDDQMIIMRFSQNTYTGTIENTNLTVESISLSSGYEAGTQFILTGDLQEHFALRPNDSDGSVLSLSLVKPLPVASAENTFIVLEIEARRERAISGWTSVVLEIIRKGIIAPVFAQAYYRGAYKTESGLKFDQVISLSHGYDDTVVFSLDGEFGSLFILDEIGTNSLSIKPLEPISNDLLQANSQFLFTVVATKPETLSARSAISIDIERDLSDDQMIIMRFSQNTYTGTIENTNLTVESISLSSGYEAGTQFILTGDLSEHFALRPNDSDGSVLSLSLVKPLPVASTENTFIVLEIEASRQRAISGWTSVVIEIIRQGIVAPVFTQAYYRGAYKTESGLKFDQVISLSHGYDDTVVFSLDGEFGSLFILDEIGTKSLSIKPLEPISNDLLQANSQFLFTVVATKPGTLPARSAISIDIERDLQIGDGVSFGRYLYQGVIDLDEVRHEPITLAGYDGTVVEILGVYSHLFEGLVSSGGVDVQPREVPLNLPADVTTVPLELRAGKAGTALLLKVLEPDQPTDPTDPTDPTVPIVPTVTFSSESYVLSVHMAQTGLVGRVSATADNREELTYSIGTDNAHLQTRLSINNEGALHLSAPANSGVYTFQVIATTVNTRATGTAVVHLTVQAVTECEDKGIAMNPLIILDRDEEEAHNNLVVLDPTLHAGCHFTLTNRWPLDQTWLYVNENGLHTIPIDREHPSIAFMPLSQVQVELVLHCEGDKVHREKRSERTEKLGDYGSNTWILTDSILFNSRRSLVNLIVNDINDNYPIFVGKENETVTVGYPINELEDRILPRSLVELKATDADIGENAMLRYWSSESVLAVAPTTGFVHVRTGAHLQHNQVLSVTATDRNGQGLSTTIQLRVKLLDLNHIAVVTIRNAFLDDEMLILARLSSAVGYEVKTLRSVVISDDIDEAVTRNKRETGTPSAALRLYVYGINEGEPVAVDVLTADITTNAAMAGVVSTIPLEDHLQDMSILDRQIGLLVATIVLSILLFAMILLVAIWFFLRWRKNKNYDKISDENSLASRNASLGELPKPEVVKPRLNIEDLKKSEKRLQDMLHAPIEEVTVEPMPMKKTEASVEAQTSKFNLPLPESGAPIVIQSIDKLKDAQESSDDEFGEVNAKPRKSVVTFNENVEKIIHVEDNADDDGDIEDDASISASVDASNDGLEIYRL